MVSGVAFGADFNVKTGYGAVGDAKWIFDAATTNASGVITSNTANWQAGDVGKQIWCIRPPTATALVAWTTISSRQSASQVTLAANANATTTDSQCVWGTQDDTTAFTDAFAAAEAAAGTTTAARLGDAGTIVVPSGAYIVSGRIYNHTGVSQASPPSFIGAGRTSTLIIMRPTMAVPGDGSGVLIHHMSGFGARFKDFAVTAANVNLPLANEQDLLRFGGSSVVVENVSVLQVGSLNAGNALAFRGIAQANVRNVTVQGASALSIMNACRFDQSGFPVVNLLCSNFYINYYITNNARSTEMQPLTLFGGGADECNTPPCTVIASNGELHVVGGVLWGSATTAVSVDGTSRLYLRDADVGRWRNFNLGGRAIDIASGGRVYASGTTIRAMTGGTTNSKAVANSGTFYDQGGNEYRLYTTGGTYTTKTAAQVFTGKLPVKQ